MRNGLLCIILASFFFAGCTAPTYRGHPQMHEKLAKAKTIMILSPDVEVYYVSAGGVTEKVNEWSYAARSNVTVALEEALRKRGGVVVPAPDIPAQEKEEIQALFEAVSASIELHTYGRSGHLFQEKLSAFDYTMGQGFKQWSGQVDALLLVKAFDNVSSGGRKALLIGAIVLAARLGIFPVSPGGESFVSMALIDPGSGEIIWFDAGGSAGTYDLRKSGSTRRLINQILADFPLP